MSKNARDARRELERANKQVVAQETKVDPYADAAEVASQEVGKRPIPWW
jgi:hypothetical protein